MSVGYVAVYEKGGNSTPSRPGHRDRPASPGSAGGAWPTQNALNTEGNPIDARACTGGSGQRWSVYSDRTLRTEGGCLDVAGGGTTSGTDVDWYPCNGTAAQVWTHAVQRRARQSEIRACLTDPNGSAAARLDIATCTGAAAAALVSRRAPPRPQRTLTECHESTAASRRARRRRPSGAAPARSPRPRRSSRSRSSTGPTGATPTARSTGASTAPRSRSPSSSTSTCPRTRPAACTSTSAPGTASTSTSSSSRWVPARSTWTRPGSTGSASSWPCSCTATAAQTQEVGENYATFKESRAATFARFKAFVPAQFKGLATIDAPYGIPSPGNDPAFQPGGKYASYFTAYAAAHGAAGDTTADVFGCGGTLSANPPLCAALNRHVAQLPASEQSNPANFYKAGPANYYAEFWHENAINGKQYGFPYDDDASQSSDISVANPEYMIVAVGW